LHPHRTSFFFDLHILVPFSPVGLYFLFNRPNDGAIFIILYGTLAWSVAQILPPQHTHNAGYHHARYPHPPPFGTSVSRYFAGVMVRLMLTLAPIACILAAIGISAVLRKFSAFVTYENTGASHRAVA
jgi:dolichyl-diphosphooligosaccharide--protein glycosyltransferase